MDKYKLNLLIKQGEGPKIDFKAKLSLATESEKKELTKDVIAIANSRGGRGYLIFGVEDKTKKIRGIDPGEFHEEQIQQTLYSRVDPPIPISLDIIEFENKKVAVVTIYKSNHQPHQMIHNGAFYIRRGSTTDTARRNEIANLLQENGLLTYETVIVKGADKSQLDMDLIRQFMANMNVVSEDPSDVLLEAMGIIGRKGENAEFNLTIGGLLLFGKSPALFLPQAYVKMVTPTEVTVFQGNILSILDQVSAYISKEITDPQYPVDAVCEAVANALVHRDYLDTARGVTVNITDKFIEISNPGALLAGNSIYRFIKENNPERRNSWLYQRILTLDNQKRFTKSGVGLTRMKAAFSEYGEVKLLNLGSQNLFKLIIPREKL